MSFTAITIADVNKWWRWHKVYFIRRTPQGLSTQERVFKYNFIHHVWWLSPRWMPVTVPLNQNGTAAFILTLTTQSNNSNDASLSGRMSPKCSEDLNRRCGLTRTLMLFGFWFSSFVFWMAGSIASTTGSSKLLFPHLTGSRLSVGTVFNQSWTSDKDPLSPATKSFAKYWSSC